VKRVCGNCGAIGGVKYIADVKGYVCTHPKGTEPKDQQAYIRACLKRRQDRDGE
jgi:hypothetical protein